MTPPTYPQYREKIAGTMKTDWRAHLRHGAKDALVFGLGTGVGAAGGALVDKVYRHFNPGQKIPLAALAVAAPVIGGLLASLYHRAHAGQAEDIEHELQNPSHHR